MIKYIKRLRTVRKKAELARKEQDTARNTGKGYTEDEIEKMCFSSSLDENMEIIRAIIGSNVDLVVRDIKLGRNGIKPAAILYFDNLINPVLLDSNIVRPLTLDAYTSGLQTGDEIIEQINAGNLITRSQLKRSRSLKDLMNGLLIGEVGLLIDGEDSVLAISTKGFEHRTVSEPSVEPVVRGPRDSFVETLSVNIGLIRRRIQSPNLVMESIKIGSVTQTKVCVSYIRGICPPELVAEVHRRLGKINIDGVLEGGYIEEFIQDNPYSPFPQVRNTERPDSASAALL